MTKIFHPNVAPSSGEICVSTLKKDWKPEYGVEHVRLPDTRLALTLQILTVVKCLLVYPNPESALNEEAGVRLARHPLLTRAAPAHRGVRGLLALRQAHDRYRASPLTLFAHLAARHVEASRVLCRRVNLEGDDRPV